MPSVARLGDAEAPHCGPMVRLGHVRSVRANGIPLSCQGHINTPHLKPCGKICCVHVAPLYTGSPNVFAEGIPLGRVGDATCTVVVQGSPNVFANGGSNAAGMAGAFGGAAPVDLTATEGSF